jgi:uncharacterized protein YdhG (YjbR/CyaY superfamily)
MTMLAWRVGDYTSKNGTKGTWPLIALAPQKNNLALYMCAVDTKQTYLAEKYKQHLGRVSTGKSCIRFKKWENINQATLKKMIQEAMKLKNPFGTEALG